jgi:hypothetical protein
VKRIAIIAAAGLAMAAAADPVAQWFHFDDALSKPPYVGALTTNYPGIVFLASFESNWVDSVSGTTGTMANAVTFTNGIYGSASFHPNGVGYVSFPPGRATNLYAYSVSAWMYPIATNLSQATVAHAYSGGTQLAYWGYGNTATGVTQFAQSMYYRTQVSGANPNAPFGSTAAHTFSAASTNKWTHLLWVFDPSSAAPNVRLYIDGVDTPIATSINPAVTNWTPSVFYLRGIASSGMSGRLDDFAIFNRALTAEEAAAIAARE